MKSLLWKSLCAGVAAWMSFASFAGTNGFTVPTIRGTAGSLFAGWETFTWGKETNNRPDIVGSTRDARLLQTHTNGFVTGSGNIYNISDPSAFKVSFASRFAIEQVVFQARTLGAELAYDSLKIHFDEAGERKSLAATRVELDRGTAQGVNVSSKWEWDLTGRDVTVFNIEFAAAGPSLSFDSATLDVSTKVIRITNARVDLDRWMYPFNATPGVRPSASVFAAFGEDSGVDTRDAQFLLGWNLTNTIPSGLGAAHYVVHKAGVTLTVNRDRIWAYDGTLDDWKSFLTTNDTRRVEDSDPGRPVELFGAGFRGGLTALTFAETNVFGGDGSPGLRFAYAAGLDTNGVLIDVSNNVGKKDEDAFEAKPFAIGVADGIEAGELVPSGTLLKFNVDFSDARVADYFSAGLNDGALRLTASSLLEGSFSGPNFAQFHTKESPLPSGMPVLDLEVQIARPEPTLTASAAIGGGTIFSWPSVTERYELEAAASLSPNAIWTPVAGASANVGGVSTLEVAAPQGTLFFRLHRVL